MPSHHSPPFKPFVPRGRVARGEDSQPQELVMANRRHTVPTVRSTPYPRQQQQQQRQYPPPAQQPSTQYRLPPPLQQFRPPSLAPPEPKILRPIRVGEEEETINGGGGPSTKQVNMPKATITKEAKETRKAKRDRRTARQRADRAAHLKAAAEAAQARQVAALAHASQVAEAARASQAATAADEEAVLRVITPPSPSFAPDVKPNLKLLRSPSPPPAPASGPSHSMAGVASWTEAELPIACNLRGPANQPARDKARRQFRLQQTWQLANERRVVTRFKWISGGLALDWSLDKSQGTWTKLFPPEVCRAMPEVRRRFLLDEVAAIEAKGWTVMLAEEKLADDGSPLGVSVAWLNDGLVQTPPPTSSRPPSDRSSVIPGPSSSRSADPPPTNHSTSAAVPARVIIDPSLAPPPSAKLSVAAPSAFVRVKPEPMDVDVTRALPPARPPPARSSPPNSTHQSAAITPQPTTRPLPDSTRQGVAIFTAPARVLPPSRPPFRPTLPVKAATKAEPKVDADPMGNPLLLVSQAVAVSQHLQAATSAAPDDELEAIESAQAEVRRLLSQAGAVLNRLGCLRDNAASQSAPRGRPQDRS